MAASIQRLLEPAPGPASRLAGLFLWQLEDQTRRLTLDTRGATPEELSWQPAPGMNTIGMLLAHIALVEVGWIEVGIAGKEWATDAVMGMPYEACGIPLAEGAPPPPDLAGRDLDYFDGLLGRARAHTRAIVNPLADADLDRRFTRIRKDGSEFIGNVGWVLYHVLEHEAGHYGQIGMLRHQYRLRQVAVARA
jgi:uncharacterized damage-inducible protein DinB